MTYIVLDQHAPGGVMKQMGDAAGGIAYNQYAPGGCYGQLYTASGVTDPPSQYAPGGPYGQIEQELEGGGEQPAWVPADAVIHIDLVGGSPQGRAWMQGTGVVAVDTLLGSDANTENAWGPTEYDAGNLIADGYAAAVAVAFVGAARSMVLGEATVRILLKQISDNEVQRPSFVIVSADGNDAIELDVHTGGDLFFNAYSWNGMLDINTAAVANTGTGASNAFAATITQVRFELAGNGSGAVSGVMDDADRPAANPLVAVLLDPFVNVSAIQSITLYDPLPSTVGLSDLSEV
jgi:hypothetical protein